MSRRALQFVLPLVLLTAIGCESLSYKPLAVGREGEITVVVDSVYWEGEVGAAIRDHLSPYIATLPAPEPTFNIRLISLAPGVLDMVQKQKNVVFMAPLSDSSGVARFLRARLDSAAVGAVMSGRTAVVPRRDLWRVEQQVYYVVAAHPQDLVQVLESSGEDMRYAFNRITRQRMERTMFEKGRQPDLEQQLIDRHGFAVNVQHDYFVAIDTTNFVWLRRVISSESWRSMFVWYTDQLSPADLTPEWIIETRDRLTRAYVQGNMGGFVRVDDRRPLEIENINFLDHFGYEARGLWHMVGPDESGEIVQFGMGGGFITYAFYDQASGRTYLIDGMVFAPGFEKREFLRQMEVIAYTFRSAPGDDTAVTASLVP